MYDQTGSTDQFQGFENEDMFNGFQQGGDFGQSIFANFAEMFMGGKKEATKRNGPDVILNMELDFMEAVKGVEKTVNYNKRCVCVVCNGTKAKPGTSPQKCNACQGKGNVNYRQGGFVIRMPCNSC